MMAAVQPFLSGAISKTVNCPNNYTVEDIKALYISAWKLGLKSIAVYRDGCKLSQPLNTKKKEVSDVTEAAPAEPKYTPAGPIMAVQLGAIRRRLPAERQAINHKFEIGGHEGYVNVGLYPDGTPGEIFLTMSKEGSTISGLMDAFATSISLGLQYGVPLATLIEKFRHTRFEPSGFTGHSEIHSASSLIDYIFHWLDLRFGAGAVPPGDAHLSRDYVSLLYHGAPVAYRPEGSDAPFCSSCGSMMVRSGSCYRCTNCGGTSGCS
jgi:ribonucleoside-diphosphate reductase alpha chain